MAVPRWVGYCTNVHAGANLDQTKANLQTHATLVREKLGEEGPLGIGLWLSASTAKSLLEPGQLPEFRDWLASAGLLPYTLNGFPYGDFHETVVKHKVYRPTWWETPRKEYTLDLIEILHHLLPEGAVGSISTLPLGWPDPMPTAEQLATAAGNLQAVALHLEQLEQQTGRLIHINIEPEPGCLIDTTEDMIRFFREHLFTGPAGSRVGRYLRVCHDVCHAAVMFEPQATVLAQYQEAGIQIGKVQVSSAIEIVFGASGDPATPQILAQLGEFAEDRYLHQTMVRTADGKQTLHEDLPPLLAAAAAEPPADQTWRIHFHLPIYLSEAGHLGTTQGQIVEFLEAARHDSEISHYEVETYAWSVLPARLKQADLASGIAEEIRWLRKQLPDGT